jgi:two-component system, NtrC family, sensor kinase
MKVGLTLRARLGLSAALVVATVVGATTFLENRILVGVVENDALDAASATALGVAAELIERQGIPTTPDLEEILGDFTRAVPALQSLTVVRAAGEEGPAVVSTDVNPSADALALAHRAIEERGRVAKGGRSSPLHYVALPLERDHRAFGAVVVAISMESLARVRQQTRLTAALFAGAAILVLVGALDFVAQRLVLRPLAAIRSTMGRASAGDLQARVGLLRRDEIGAVGQGLDTMLDHTADFNAALQREVMAATQELRESNRQLVESAQRLFAARRDLARSEQLAAAGRMAASVAHQVGTPLNLISGYVQMLLAEQPEGSGAATRLRTVREQIAKVIAIVQGLLDQARQPILDRRVTDPAALLEGVADLARPTLQAAAVELVVERSPGLPPVWVDAGQIEQALLNLVTNSVDAMAEGGRLRLSARAVPGFVELEVADSGHGIPPEILSRVFDPLFTTKPVGRGTGLGLTIVRDVVVAHGGTVDFASGPGEGTTVTVRLPRAAESVAHA